MDEVKLNLYTALKRMNELTEAGAPFKIEFMKLNGERRIINKAVLRKSYRNDFSTRGKFLVGYEDLENDKRRQFHRSLLLKLNDIEIIR